jgi:hypothetical protein
LECAQRIPQPAIKPVKNTDAVFLREAERRRRTRFIADAHIQSQSLTLGILIHELRSRPAFTRQQTTADQCITLRCEMRNLQTGAQPFRQPANKMFFLVGTDFDRMPDLRAVYGMGHRGNPRNLGGLHPSTRHLIVQMPTRCPADQNQHRSCGIPVPGPRFARAVG